MCVVDNVVVANPFGAISAIETDKKGSFEADEIAEVVVCLVEYVLFMFHSDGDLRRYVFPKC